ncbi:MAG: 3-oxoadipate enol-lactonase [Chloroflexota bacterium]
MSIPTSMMTLDDGTRLAYRVDGPADGPALLFINSLGCDLRMWEPQATALSDEFRIVRFDNRGHGCSDAPPGEYTLERLGLDAIGLLDGLGIERAHVCGLSLGGVIALWLAIHRPARIGRAVFANTAARVGSAEMWDEGIRALHTVGLAAIGDGVVEQFLSADFRERDPVTTQMIRTMVQTTPLEGYIGCCAALRDADLRNMVSTIEARSLVIGSELDVSTPPSQAEDLHAAIVPSELMVIPGVAHLTNLEAPALFTRRVRELLSQS